MPIDGKVAISQLDPIDGSWAITNIDIPVGNVMMTLTVRALRASGVDAGLADSKVSVVGDAYLGALRALGSPAIGEPDPAKDIDGCLRYRLANSKGVQDAVNPRILSLLGGR